MHINSFYNHDDNKLVSATNLINLVQFICIMEYDITGNEMACEIFFLVCDTHDIWNLIFTSESLAHEIYIFYAGLQNVKLMYF